MPVDKSDPFFKILRERNTGPDGKEKDPGLWDRLDHPICRDCQARYKEKFPGKPFAIVCSGIYSDPDFEKLAKSHGLNKHEVRELLDVAYWAKKYVKVLSPDGELVDFKARDYQMESLLCTAQRQVDRWGRGMGKTICGVIKELHTAMVRQNSRILIICPAQAQSQMWYDELTRIIDSSPELTASLQSRSKQPYFKISFVNGSVISIFTAGSQSGRNASSVRGQSPNRVRIDEMDLLAEEDWVAITPLLRRYENSEFHGSSTPTGRRGTFYKMCREFPDYKELHFPINRHPHWSGKMEEACRREARTEQNFLHEFMAEFGDLEDGVFAADLITRAKKPYLYSSCRPESGWKYYMGVDWNGRGIGTKIRIVGYNPVTKTRRVVYSETSDASTEENLQAIIRANRIWNCSKIYVDRGYGYVQDEMLRKYGESSNHPADKVFRDLVTIDFGAVLKTNRLVPKREGSKYLQDHELERPTKPFMVEGFVIAMEKCLFEFSDEDFTLEQQMRDYRIKAYSRHGWATQYESKSGDHDLDATMLAMLAVEMEHGLTSGKPATPIARLTYTPPPSPSGTVEERIRAFQEQLGIAGRSDIPVSKKEDPAKVVPAGDRLIAYPSRQNRPPAASYQVLDGPPHLSQSDPGSRTFQIRPGGRIPSQLLNPSRKPRRPY